MNLGASWTPPCLFSIKAGLRWLQHVCFLIDSKHLQLWSDWIMSANMNSNEMFKAKDENIHRKCSKHSCRITSTAHSPTTSQTQGNNLLTAELCSFEEGFSTTLCIYGHFLRTMSILSDWFFSQLYSSIVTGWGQADHSCHWFSVSGKCFTNLQVVSVWFSKHTFSFQGFESSRSSLVS